MAYTFDFNIVRGDTWSLEFTAIAATGTQGEPTAPPTASVPAGSTAVNITGASIRAVFKFDYDELDAVQVFALTSPSSGLAIVDAATGRFTMTIVAANLATFPRNPWPINLVYDIQMTLGANVYTLTTGTIRVDQDVSITQP